MEQQTIKIECQGATTVNIDELNELHHFKKTSDQQYAHLRNSLTEFGFSFPFQIWIDEAGNKWIMDGHRRKPTLLRMRDEGFILPLLPASIVFAKDKKEAKMKLLAMESKYGSYDESGMEDFMKEEDSSLMDVDLTTFVEIPELDFGEEITSGDSKENNQPQLVQCPSCQTQFQVKENLV